MTNPETPEHTPPVETMSASEAPAEQPLEDSQTPPDSGASRAAKSRPEDPVLTPQLSAAWALAPRHLALLGFFCFLVMVLNYLPLRGTDLWGHVAYGNWILDQRQLPTEDPFASLAEGMRVIDSAWLAQVTLAYLERIGGAEALSTTFALLSLAYFAFVTRACFLQSRRMAVAWAGLLVTLLVGFSRLTTIRPENFGAAAFGILLWLLVRHGMLRRHSALDEIPKFAKRPPQWRLYVGIFLIMGLWANFHGSFVCGLAVLGCLLMGQIIETAWSTRDIGQVFQDKNCRRALLVLELGLIATLINPYGFDLLLMSAGFASKEVLNDVLEWRPLTLTGIGGREFAASWIIITLVLRHSRQRVSVGESLMLGLFALLAASRLRMIGWYAAVTAVFLAPHLAEIWGRFAKPVETEPELMPRDNPLELTMGRSWTYSLVAMLMIWISFALSPLGRPVIGDEPRELTQMLDSKTPLTASAYLRENPPETIIFNPQWWGDWLVWDGPEGLKPFVTTNMHLIPSQVWADYRRIMSMSSGWERSLSRYDMDTVVLDQTLQSRLVRAMKRSSDWKTQFEDDQAIILTRVIEGAKAKATPPADEPPADEPPADEPPEDEPPEDEPPADELPKTQPSRNEPATETPPAAGASS